MYMILLCLFIATLLPILAKAPLALAQVRDGGYDNHHPRSQQARLTGFGARAKAGHENAFEALVLFTPGALGVIATDAVSMFTETLAVGFVLARVAYHICYLLDWDKLRSLVWATGFICSLLLMWEAVSLVALPDSGG
ncbi:MAPEG family protein [Bowmanella dokdonensis]|uniref:MAPEG family protein n=1 Tax=Bowmanella dokdonensis TaxID=751969 RepID=A0A939ILE9_9ALTE|nr:MAPEG family protein [Bowmanella dokdonensis]MBN7824143.1 MAPEG family protein [Bowmanella dokdonensis]